MKPLHAITLLLGFASLCGCGASSSARASQTFCPVADTSLWKMTTSNAQKYPGRFVLHRDAIESEPGDTWGVYWCNQPLPADFILRLEWLRHESNDNSGVFIRFPNPEEQGERNTALIAARGFEVQIDELGSPDGAPYHRTGAIYGQQAQRFSLRPALPIGRWNAYEIEAKGQHYRIRLNGAVVSEFTNYDRNRAKATVPGKPSYFGLEAERGHVEFRNIRIEKLSATASGLNGALIPVTSISLPGGTTRFDYQSIDPKRHLLFIAHLGDSAVDVIDLRKNSIRAVIPNISQVHGVLAVPELGRVYATATGSNQLAVIDEKTLHVIARSPAGEYPDGIAYVPPQHKLYISDETGGTDTVIDVRTNRRVATIPLGGEAGNTQFDARSGRIFVNAQSINTLIEIDPRNDRIVERTHLPYCNSNHGLLLNEAARIAYIACDGNATLLTYDMGSGKVTAKDSVGDGPDVLAYDAKFKRLYVAAESGVVAVFAVKTDGSLSKLWMGLLTAAAHSVAIDPANGYAYFPIQSGPVLKIFRPAK